MISRFGCQVKVIGEVDAEGYVKAIRLEDKTEREYHLGDLCTQTSDEDAWMQEAFRKTMELRSA
jgi:hypothetical protein